MNMNGPENSENNDSHKKTPEEGVVDIEALNRGIKELQGIREAALNITKLISIEKIIENHEKGIPGMMLDENAPDVVSTNIQKIAEYFSTEKELFSTFRDNLITWGVDIIMKNKEAKYPVLDARDMLEDIQADVVVFNEGQEQFKTFLESLKQEENENLGIKHDHAEQVMKRLISKASNLGFKIEELIEKIDHIKQLGSAKQ